MSDPAKGFFVYLLKCRDGTYYTGWTTDLSKRVNAHQRGQGARYTKGRLPVQLVYWEALESKSAALRREHQLRHFSRKKKDILAKESSGSASASACPIHLPKPIF